MTKNYQFNNDQTDDGISVTVNTVHEDKLDRKAGWTKVDDSLLRRRDMDSTQKLLLSVLIRLSLKEGFAWVSVIGLGVLIGMTAKATRRAINRLIEAGHIERIERYRNNLQITNQWLVHVQPVRTPPQRHGGDRESEETRISGVSLRSPPDIKETSTGRDVRAGTVPSDRTNGSVGDNSQAEPNICPNFLVGSASSLPVVSAPRFENEASLNPQQFLEVVEYACQQAASRNGVRCYPRSRIDPAIADCLSGKLYKRGMHFGDVYMALAEYFSQSPSQDRGFYTLTQFELWLETKIPGLRNKNLPEPEDSNLFENSPDAEWDTPRDQWKNWTVEKVNGKTVRLPKVEVLKRYKSNLFEVYLEGGTEKVRRKDKDSEGILALTGPLCGHD